ncbi:Uma2 family endonuclease [Streptomyces sp. NPDC020096]
MDRTEMADSDGPSLDELFERLEHMPVPEGYKVEIVEGAVYMSPQRDAHWEIIRRIVRALEDRFGMDTLVKSDVRIDFGDKNGLAPDVAKIADDAKKERGRWRYQDVEFIAEVISKDTASNDYGPKKTAYAAADVAVYLIVDPYTGECHLFTNPKDGTYRTETTTPFGEPVDLTDTVVGLTLATDKFPRD